MHILLTDILSCPRCGPEFGLIVLADRIEDRRVLSGGLGCANCRNEYPVRDGVADLRFGASPEPQGDPAIGDAERAFRLAALSGVGDRPGSILVGGAHPLLVAGVAEILPQAQVVGIASSPPLASGGGSWVLAHEKLPFRDRTLLAALMVGSIVPQGLGEIARVVPPGGRLVLDGVGDGAGAGLPPRDWTVLLEQDGVAVASRNAPG